jgi:hypothetical protein
MLAPIKTRESGWRAYAVQAVVNHDTRVALDGAFGPKTEEAVKTWQGRRNLAADGIVGPKTQGAMLRSSEHAVNATLPTLPPGLLWGFVVHEGAGLLAATNPYTPPGGAAGVDCGPVQWRQYGPPFKLDGLKAAFDARRALAYAGRELLRRRDDYRQRRPSLSRARALELAVLAHNAPFLSEQVVRSGTLRTPHAPAAWTTKPGGGHYTHAEWAAEYPRRIMSYAKT